MKKVLSIQNFLIIVMISAGGCASLTRGGKQTVTMSSEPTGAIVAVGDSQGMTPFKVSLSRKDSYTVTAWHEGFVPVTFNLEALRDYASAPDLILPGGTLMMATDVASGADKAYAPDIHIKFTQPTSAPTTQPFLMKEFHGLVLTPDEYKEAEAKWKQQMKDLAPKSAKHN